MDHFSPRESRKKSRRGFTIADLDIPPPIVLAIKPFGRQGAFSAMSATISS
jgi:hypothetical protein